MKIMKVLRTANLGSNFTGSYKKECSALCQNKFLLISLIDYSDISFSYSITHQWHNSQAQEILRWNYLHFSKEKYMSWRIHPPIT